MMGNPILISSIGLKGREVYVDSAKGGCHPLRLSKDKDFLGCDESFLEPGEEFRIAVPVKDETEARAIFDIRRAEGVHVGKDFNFDAKQNIFWCLAENFPTSHLRERNQKGEYNQKNVNPSGIELL